MIFMVMVDFLVVDGYILSDTSLFTMHIYLLQKNLIIINLKGNQPFETPFDTLLYIFVLSIYIC